MDTFNQKKIWDEKKQEQFKQEKLMKKFTEKCNRLTAVAFFYLCII